MMPMIQSQPHSSLLSPLRDFIRGFRMAGFFAGLCLVWSGGQAAVPGYGDFDAVLLRNVDRGFVDYAGIAADPAFARFVMRLEDTRPEDAADSRARGALLINAYKSLSDASFNSIRLT